jgi:hypothetical protein
MYANDMLAKNPKVFQVQELPKTALYCEKRPFSRYASETAKWLGSLAWNCPTTRPKNNAPNNGGAFRAINAPPQTLNVHKFPFIEVPYRQAKKS